MLSLPQLFSSQQYCEDAVIHFCRYLGLKITSGSIIQNLQEHPDYPSLVSVGDVLNDFGVASVCLKAPISKLENLPMPFLAHLDNKSFPHSLFVPVYGKNEGGYKLYNPQTKLVEYWDTDSFSKSYLNVVLIPELSDNSGEKNYDILHKYERRKLIKSYLIYLILPILATIICVINLLVNPIGIHIYPIFFTLLSVVGSIVCLLIVSYDIDKNIFAAKKVCQINTKTSCLSVLSSKGAKILGESWGNIGFVYFTAISFMLLVTGIANPSVLKIIGLFTLCALPFTLYSIYYQAKIIKQWCPLCLFIQGILLLQFIVAYSGNLYAHIIPHNEFIFYLSTIIICFILIYLSVHESVNMLKENKQIKANNLELKRLKNNPVFFKNILENQDFTQNIPSDLGINIGELDAPFKIVKVCNPFCDHCAKAHSVIDELIDRNENLSLQIIFTSTDNNNDIRKAPVAHLLAIASSSKGIEVIKPALNDWYGASSKDYNRFSSKYPLKDVLECQDEGIRKMDDWCKTEKITFTPKFYISLNTNNEKRLYHFPEIYTIAELKYLLRQL